MEILIFTGGLIIGAFITSLCNLRFTKIGTLRIDHSDPEKDRCVLEINPIADLRQDKKYIIKVDHHADLSQQ